MCQLHRWLNGKFSVTPVTPSAPSIGGPQAKALMELMIEFRLSIVFSRSPSF